MKIDGSEIQYAHKNKNNSATIIMQKMLIILRNGNIFW